MSGREPEASGAGVFPRSLQEPEKVRGMFASIAGRYDLANHLLSGGMDFYWRARAVSAVGRVAPRAVLDLATGSGDLALALAAKYRGARVVGADFCLPMLELAKRKGVRELVAADGTRLPFADGAFCAVTVAFGLRNMVSIEGALGEMRRVLRPGGMLAVLDFALPGGWLRPAYRWYLHAVLPVLAGWIAGDREAYRYLGESIERFPRGEAMLRLFRAAGFAETRAEPLTGGIVSLYTGVRAG